MLPDHDTQAQAWSSPPVDHKNAYIPSEQLMRYDDQKLDDLIARMGQERYGGWRNYREIWTGLLLANVAGKRVLDYGCGVGLEAHSLAARGALVDLADISMSNLLLARRVLNREPSQRTVPHLAYLIRSDYPFIEPPPEPYDIFYCNGVLHHIPHAAEVMRRAWEITRPGGQARLMLYTDDAWRNTVGTEPPQFDTHLDPKFETFVRAMDGVGHYADWYSPAKLRRMVEPRWLLEHWSPMTPWGNYAAAILRRCE